MSVLLIVMLQFRYNVSVLKKVTWPRPHLKFSYLCY